MKKFLYLLITCLIIQSASGQKTKKLGIEFTDMSYDFGDIQMWENQPAIFTLTNNSKYPISILPLFSEYDLEIIYPERAILPGEQAIIKAIYYTSGLGSFMRKFPIYLNTSPEAYSLKITGNIKSLSPTAYIQCPMAKPEHSKPKVELFGNVAEIESEIPLSGSSVHITGITNKIDLTFYADKFGDFGSKLPIGNYEIVVDHPRYLNHQSIFYLGQQSGYLKIRLTPMEEEQLTASIPKQIDEEKIRRKDAEIDNPIKQEPQVSESAVEAPPLNSLATGEKTISTTISSNNSEEVIPAHNNKNNNKPIPVEDVNILEVDIYERTAPSANIVRADEPIVNEQLTLKEYTIRVIDELGLEPVSEAEIFVNLISNKKNTSKTETNQEGLASIQLEKEDYKIVVNADNYISGEAAIKAEQDEDIIRVYLRPVSDLFEELYTAKKEELLNTGILNDLSFGTTKFEFAEESSTKTTLGTRVPSEAMGKSSVEGFPIQEGPSIALIETSPYTPRLNIDSIQTYLAVLELEKKALELSLSKAAIELSEKEDKIAKNQIELASKDEDLIEQAKELDKARKDLENHEETLFLAKESAIEIERDDEILPIDDYAANNVLFLIDVSSSMAKENKIELLKASLKSLTAALRDIDRVAIIAYNQKTKVILQSISGDNKSSILEAIDSLETSGLTYGVNGLQTAYELLQYFYIGEGNNQIILATDGLFSSANASMTENELNKEVRKQANNKGIKLSVIGFGQDEEGKKLMQKLANNGEGQFIQIRNPWEARTVLVDEIKLNSKR